MIRVAKPRNARSKRALEKRSSKEYENAKRALFMRGPHSSEKVAMALREFAQLKKPDAIPFNKQNDVTPFEDAASLEFMSKKNDASLILFANHQKKRPHNLTWVRMFDGTVLDMYEMGITAARSNSSASAAHSPSIGARPLFHFTGPHFATLDENQPSAAAAASACTPGVAQSFQHLKSLLLDFYRGEEVAPSSNALSGARVALKGGLQHVISVTEAPSETYTPSSSNGDLASMYKSTANGESTTSSLIDTTAQGRTIHLRVYALVPEKSTVRLEEIGPSFDFTLRRRQMPTIDKLSASLRRPRTQAEKARQGKGGAKKNIETDEMGDMVGRVHVGKQDLSKLQTRKMKGLKRGRDGDDDAESDAGEEADGTSDILDEQPAVTDVPKRSRRS